jgi:dienelactone hydrolase
VLPALKTISASCDEGQGVLQDDKEAVNMMKLTKVLAMLVIAGFSASCVSANTSDSGPVEESLENVARTWNAARVFLPSADGPVRLSSLGDLQRHMTETKELLPIVIHMHGCSGFWPGTNRRGRYLASLGFAVIAPDSFARTNKKKSCDPVAKQGGFFRGTLAQRQAEAAYAISRVRALPWVNKAKMVLSGHSEGAITTATLAAEHTVGFSARVIEGWGCHSGWQEYAGLNSSTDQPVLSLVGDRDPWFRLSSLQGDCAEFMKNAESHSIVYREIPLIKAHSLLDYNRPREDLKSFLCEHVHCAAKNGE